MLHQFTLVFAKAQVQGRHHCPQQAVRVQDSPNKVGIMSSKSVGEPPLLTTVSVLTAFQAVITAAKQGLADLQAGQAHGHANGNTNGESESVREQVLKQLQAPVTVKEVKRVIGDLHLSQLLLSSKQ